MEDFFQIFSYLTVTFVLGLYIKRLRPVNKNNSLKKKEYNEIKDFNILHDAEDIIEDSILQTIIQKDQQENENISDISSSTSDEEFIIINEV